MGELLRSRNIIAVHSLLERQLLERIPLGAQRVRIGRKEDNIANEIKKNGGSSRDHRRYDRPGRAMAGNNAKHRDDKKSNEPSERLKGI